LNIEHVSLAELMQQEISRHTPIGHVAERASRNGKPVGEETILAVMRRWFWARKPDAGFLLEGFPATLLQALVFDEWLEARGENLTAVFASETTSVDLVTYYRTQGLTPVSLPAAA
jgi:adenylate kinase